ncbi:MAG TPA: SurA N-terminal domain-containing protein [Allosphingosinicella sp.]|nr:SurA N-terminal domain-containing protein [Allosphingosinicella sp.]
MISGFRKSLRSWATVLLLFIALVAIVVTGFGTGGFGGLGSLSGGGRSDGSDTLATIDGRALSASEVNDLVNRQFANLRQQQPTLDMASFLAQGAFEQTLDQLVTARAIELFGERQGLVASQTMIDREVVNIPAFRNLTGQFDQNVMREQLQAQNINEAAFRENVAQTLMRRQLLGPVVLGTRVPEAVAREYANLLLERRRGLIGAVPIQIVAQGIEPTDAEIAAFFRRNRIAFTRPERRVVKYALIGPEQVARAGQATEAEILAVYRNSPRSYGPRETRDIQSIVLPSRQAAQAFADRVRGGAGFVEAAAQAGFAAGDVSFPNQTRAQFEGVANREVAAAAFAAAQGAVVGPLRSELGYHVVRIERITATPARPLEAVRGEIAAAIEARKRIDALSALVSRIEDRIADGASFEEMARAEQLAIVTTPPITETGQPGGDDPFVMPAELRPLLRPAFEIDAEDPEPLVEQIVANQRFALLGIERVLPAAVPPLAEVRPEVRIALIRQRAGAQARAVADRIAARINAGTPPAQAFAEAQPRLPAPRAVDMRRLDISRSGQQVPRELIGLFSIPQGRARVIPAEGNAGWLVVYHQQRTPGDASATPQLIQQTRTQFAGEAGEELAQQFARAVELKSEVSRNQDAIRRARQQLGGGAPAAD